MRAQVHLQSQDPAEVKPLLEDTKPHSTVGLTLLALASIVSSLVSTCAKYETIDLSAMEIVFWRFAVGYIFVLVLALYTKADLIVPSSYHGDLISRCVYGFAAVASLFWAISQTTLADANTLASISPLVAFFLTSCLSGFAVGLMEIVSALVAFVGVVFVWRPTVLFEAPILTYGSYYAPLAAIVSAVFAGLASVHLRRLESLHFIVVAHYFLLTGAALSGLWVLVAQGEFNLYWSGRTVTQAAIATGFMGFLSDLALAKGLQLEGTTVHSIVRYLDIAFIFLWDATLLQERINLWSIFGGVFIAAAIATIFVRNVHIR